MSTNGLTLRKTPKPTRQTTTPDLYWAAGLLDGEGSFRNPMGGSEVVNCWQKDPELLFKLGEIFGGRVYMCRRKVQEGKHRNVLHAWSVYGPTARGVMMTLFKLMSTRRKGQIVRSLAGHTNRKGK